MSVQQFEKMPYEGPQAEVASVSGSVFAGKSVSNVVAGFENHGWTPIFQQRVPTPYGLGPRVHIFETPTRRNVLWIPFYGRVIGRDDQNPAVYPRDLFWILWKAGVEVIVCGSVCGSADWRNDESRIRPRDIVIPWSFWREYSMVGSLPGTEIKGLYPNLALMGDAYCKVLGEDIAQRIEENLVPKPFRRVHRPQEVQTFMIQPLGGGMTWESDAETNIWRRMCRMLSQDGEGDLVPLFGGAGISPPLARKIGAHLALYILCTDDAHGVAETPDEVVEHIDDLYLNISPDAFLNFEAKFLEELEVPGNCTCMDHLRERPRQYVKAFTQPTPSGF